VAPVLIGLALFGATDATAVGDATAVATLALREQELRNVRGVGETGCHVVEGVASDR
jgi:hypothetical protein